MRDLPYRYQLRADQFYWPRFCLQAPSKGIVSRQMGVSLSQLRVYVGTTILISNRQHHVPTGEIGLSVIHENNSVPPLLEWDPSATWWW